MGPDPTGGQDDSDRPFLSIEEVLCGVEEAQEPQNAVSSVEHGSHKVDGPAERPAPIDCDDVPAPGAIRGGGIYGKTNGRSSIRPSSDGSIPIEKGALVSSPDTLAVSVLGPEITYIL